MNGYETVKIIFKQFKIYYKFKLLTVWFCFRLLPYSHYCQQFNTSPPKETLPISKRSSSFNHTYTSLPACSLRSSDMNLFFCFSLSTIISWALVHSIGLLLPARNGIAYQCLLDARTLNCSFLKTQQNSLHIWLAFHMYTCRGLHVYWIYT